MRNIVYEIPNEIFIKKIRIDRILSFVIGIPIIIILIVLYLYIIHRHGIQGLFQVFFYISTILMLLIMITILGLHRSLTHRRLVIYQDGITPLRNPLSLFFKSKVYLHISDIEKIALILDDVNQSYFSCNINDIRGKRYSINTIDLIHYLSEDYNTIRLIRDELCNLQLKVQNK